METAIQESPRRRVFGFRKGLLAALTVFPVLSAVAEEPASAPYTDLYERTLEGAQKVSKEPAIAPNTTSNDAQLVTVSILAYQKNTHRLIIAKRLYKVAPDYPLSDTIKSKGSEKAHESALEAITLPGKGAKLLWSTVMVGDRIIIGLKDGKTTKDLKEHLVPPTTFDREIGSPKAKIQMDLVHVKVDSLEELETILTKYRAMTDLVEFAEPDHVGVELAYPPNDPYFTTSHTVNPPSQWHMVQTKAVNAWQAGVTDGGGDTNTIAVLDSGIDFTHPDLVANITTTGYGYDFVDNDADPSDKSGHGTHVSGTIAAQGDDQRGGLGVCWSAKLLPLRIIDTNGNVAVSAAINAIQYIASLQGTSLPTNPATLLRITVANHSWGMTGFNRGLWNAVDSNFAASVPMPPAKSVTATWSNASCALTISGSTANVALIKRGMTVNATGLVTAGPVVLADPQGIVTTGGVSTATLLISDPPTVLNQTTAVGLTFSNPLGFVPTCTVHVAAVGDRGANADAVPIFPACLPSPLVISVGGSDGSDAPLVSGSLKSDTGHYSVDLFAPALSIVSTYWNNVTPPPNGYIGDSGSTVHGYYPWTGTSLSAPQVTGAVALVRKLHPTWTEQQVKAVVLQSVDPVAGLAGKCVTGGRLNVQALVQITTPPTIPGDAPCAFPTGP